MDKNQTMSLLYEGLMAYEKIVEKKIHYVYLKNGSYHELVLDAKRNYFMHLCGVKYKNPKTNKLFKAGEFYKQLKKRKLSPDGIQKKDDGSTDQKLNVIKNLNDLTTCNLRVVDESGVFLNLSFDKAIRSRRQIFCLALQGISDKKFVPSSLLDLRSPKGQVIKAGYPIHCVYSIDNSSGNMQIMCKTEEFEAFEKEKGYTYSK